MSNCRAGELIGVWQLEDRIGSGGMGDVHLAHRIDGVVKQRAAIKVLRAENQDIAQDEAAILRSLDHPNIAKCSDSGLTADGRTYLVMEYVEGSPITEHADQNGLSVHRRIELFRSACSAIEYSHHHLVLHLDLKPANILVNRDGQVKVIDFGVSRQVRGADRNKPAVAFSGPYASPEQIEFGSRLGFPADIYALGAVLYELLCGHEPFSPHLAAAELERQIFEDAPRAPSAAIYDSKVRRSDAGKNFRVEPEDLARMRGGCRLSEARKLIAGDLDRICLFALRKEASRRYRSVEDLQSDLEKVLEGRRPSIARSGDPMYSTLRMARREPLAVLSIIAVITALLAGYTLWVGFSAGRTAIVEKGRRYDQASEGGVMDLRERLRPKLTSDPRLRPSLDALDNVVRVAAPVPSARTIWDKIREYLLPFMYRRRLPQK